MSMFSVLRVAIKAIGSNKLRTFLTMLGVIIGVTAVIMMVSISTGTEATIAENINSLGAKIPTAWLLIIPIANIYWVYKYCEGFAQHVKKDNNGLVWFIVYLLVGFVMPAIVQSELNKLA